MPKTTKTGIYLLTEAVRGHWIKRLQARLKANNMTTKTKEKTIVFDRQEIGFYSPDYPTVLAHEGFKEAMLAEGNVVLSVSSRVLLVTQGTIGYAGGTLKSRKKMQEKIDNNPPRFDKILLPKKITKNSNAKRK